MDRVHRVVHGPGPQKWSMDPGPCFVYVHVNSEEGSLFAMFSWPPSCPTPYVFCMGGPCTREQIAAADNHDKRDAWVSNFYRYGALLPRPFGPPKRHYNEEVEKIANISFCIIELPGNIPHNLSRESLSILPLHFFFIRVSSYYTRRKQTKKKEKKKTLFQVSRSWLHYSLHPQTTINPCSLCYPLFQVSYFFLSQARYTPPRRAQLLKEPGCATVNWPKILSFWAVSRCWNPRRK